MHYLNSLCRGMNTTHANFPCKGISAGSILFSNIEGKLTYFYSFLDRASNLATHGNRPNTKFVGVNLRSIERPTTMAFDTGLVVGLLIELIRK